MSSISCVHNGELAVPAARTTDLPDSEAVRIALTDSALGGQKLVDFMLFDSAHPLASSTDAVPAPIELCSAQSSRTAEAAADTMA